MSTVADRRLPDQWGFGRDLVAIEMGLEEVLDTDYLRWRTMEEGVPIVQRPGGHAIYVDAARMLWKLSSSPVLAPLQRAFPSSRLGHPPASTCPCHNAKTGGQKGHGLRFGHMCVPNRIVIEAKQPEALGGRFENPGVGVRQAGGQRH